MWLKIFTTFYHIFTSKFTTYLPLLSPMLSNFYHFYHIKITYWFYNLQNYFFKVILLFHRIYVVKVVKVVKISLLKIIFTYENTKKIIVDKTKIKAFNSTYQKSKNKANQKNIKGIYHFSKVVNYLVNVVNDKKENLNERMCYANRLCKKA